MKWITNCHKSYAKMYISDLTLGHENRKIVEGDPMPTEALSSDELKAREVVGLYEGKVS